LPVELPFLKFGGNVLSSTEALLLGEVPKKLVVVGAGYIGLELGIAFRKLGGDVTVVEAMDRILPLYDAPLVAPVAKWLEKNGVTVHLGATAKGLVKDGKTLSVETKDGKRARSACRQDFSSRSDASPTQRAGASRAWPSTGTGVSSRSTISAEPRCAACGRLAISSASRCSSTRRQRRARWSRRSLPVTKRAFRPASIPAVCFTEPEIVSAGLLPSDVSNEDVVTAIFPFSANGRALSMESGDDGGFVRIVASKADHRILGIQAVGAHVSELSGEFSHALEMGALLEDVAGTIHVHPTLGEAYHEAALRALGHAIHI
jgi:dihydrolipoamide dehydrogenase